MKANEFNHFEVRKERLVLLFDALLSSQIGMFIAAIVLAYILFGFIATKILIIWFSVLFISIVYRLLLYFSFFKIQIKNKSDVQNWENRFLLGVLLSSISWGSAGYYLFPHNDVIHQAFLEVVLIGVASVSIGTLSPNLRAILLFIPITLLPVSINAWLSGHITGFPLFILIIIFILVSYSAAKRFNTTLVEILSLRYKTKKHEKALQQSEEKYRLLYEKSEDPMMVISNNKFSLANMAAVRLFGYSSEEHFMRAPVWDLSPKYQPCGMLSKEKSIKYMKVVKDKGHHEFEWTYTKLNGGHYVSEVTLTRIPSDAEASVFCVFRDVSKNKAIEKKLKDAFDLAESANIAKSNFLANVSHEIRTPMNSIIGYSDLLVASEISQKQKSQVQAIRSSAKDLLVIINDILDYSKIEAGQLSLNANVFNLNELFQNLYLRVETLIKKKNLNFICNIPQELQTWYFGDSVKLLQILINLVGNAIKFTKEGKIEVNCKEVSNKNGFTIIHFTVKDTGIGIAKDQFNSIFSRFTQVDNSSSRKLGGTGLGLSISQELTQFMGGEIGFDSEENLGSEFWFTIRLKKSSMPIIENQQDNLANPLHYFHARVLIVDDNETNLLVAQEVIKSLGVSTTTVLSGHKAIKILKQQEFDLVFMDCQMPVLDGFETTKMIRNPKNKALNPNMPIIAITANAMQGTKEKCLDIGMNDYIPKPIDVALIREKLEYWLNKDKNNQLDLKNKQKHRVINTHQGAILFDYPAIHERLGGNLELINKVLKKFVNSIENQIEDVRVLVKNKEFDAIAVLAHKLKGSVSTIGCDQLNLLIIDIEQAGKDQDLRKIQQLIPAIIFSYQISKQAIEKKLPEILLPDS